MTTDANGTKPQSGLTRRDLVGAAATMGVAALARSPAAAADLPSRGEFVVRNAHVLTSDPQIPDLERGDVHVRNGEIVAVGQDVAAPGAMAIDARKMIALPGLTDTHNHLWNSACRNLVMEGPVKGYFPVVYALGQQFSPEDIYRGVRL